MTKKLFHTSPEEIQNIHNEGLFGSQLFFSDEPYYMSNNYENANLYELETNDEDFLDINTIPYLESEKFEKIKPFIEKVEKMTGVNEDEALNLLSEKIDIHSFVKSLEDYVNFYSEQDKSEHEKKRKFSIFEKLKDEDLGEISWSLQNLAGLVAKKLGYKGVKLFDEQGTSYLIDMFGREKDLKKSK